MSEGWRAPGVASNAFAKKDNHESRHVVRDARDGEYITDNISHGHPEASIAQASINYVALTLPQQPTPNPMEIYISFFLSQFRSDLPKEARPLHDNCRRCFALLLNEPTSSRIGESCTNPVIIASEALVKCHFGKVKGSYELLRESLRSYSTALRTLATKLNEVQSLGISTISEENWMDLAFSCLLLAFWEVSYSLPYPACSN
jgi:hypothetical protein